MRQGQPATIRPWPSSACRFDARTELTCKVLALALDAHHRALLRQTAHKDHPGPRGCGRWRVQMVGVDGGGMQGGGQRALGSVTKQRGQSRRSHKGAVVKPLSHLQQCGHGKRWAPAPPAHHSYGTPHAPATACPRRGAGAGPSSCSCVHWAGPSPSRPRRDQSSLVTPAGKESGAAELRIPVVSP